MDPNLHIKSKRKIFGPVAIPQGFIYSHQFKDIKDYNPETKKWIFKGRYFLALNLTFYWLGSCIEIHNNSDKVEASFTAYVDKIHLIDRMVNEAYEHITKGKGPVVIREFLNDPKINDGFGATLFIHIDPDMNSNFCIFEISSCYRKYRHSGDVKEMKTYLSNLVDFLSQVKEDLSVLKEKIERTEIKED